VSVSQETKTPPATRSGWHGTDASAVARELGVKRLPAVETLGSTWGICIGIAASLVVVEELIKLATRQRDRRRVAAAPRLSVSGA
jgi:hypothetical protein